VAGESAYYLSTNRNKRSLAIDLADPRGADLIRKLAAEADIVVENFKVGGLVKYGLDAASLRAAFPRLICCSITGFGQDGPYAERAGYDFLIQGMAGPMSITGEPGGQPTKAGYATADIFTGLYASVGILSALRQRDQTGIGATLDLALMDTQIAVMGNQAMNYLVSGKAPGRLGNAHPNIVPYEVFEVADGHVIIASGNDGQYRKLCEALGQPGLGTDARYATNKDRISARAELVPVLNGLTRTLARADLLARLEVAGVPAGPINGMGEVFADPQVVARGIRRDLAAPAARGGRIPTVASPIVMDGVRQVSARPSPRLGEHNLDVLQDPAWGGQP
jgi:crotonobetainyl-CoA:carnitine CoA-transferase CaiB-like acyl-CoA transferase